MALKLVKDYKGYEAEYWKINEFRYNILQGRCEVMLTLYKDKSVRDSSISEFIYNETLSFDYSSEPTLASLYVKIKEPNMKIVYDNLRNVTYINADNEAIDATVLQKEDGSYYYVDDNDAEIVVTILKENVNPFSGSVDC